MTNESLATAIQNGQDSFIEQLWLQCYGYIRKQAIRWAAAWSRTDVDADDLTQSGYFAICAAVEGWDADRGCSFISYLDFCLKTEYAKAVGCRTTAQSKEPIHNSIRFETPVSNDSDGLAIGDKLGADCVELEAADESIYQDQLSSLVREAVAALPDRQQQAIEAHYLQGRSYSEICQDMNCASSYVGQLCKCGLRSLKKGKYHDRLSEMLYGDRNLYRGTGLSAFKDRGSSVEMEAIRHEQKMTWINSVFNEIDDRQHETLKIGGQWMPEGDIMERKICWAVERLGWTRERAERVFSV